MASLVQIAQILRCFSHSTEPLTVTQLSERLGLHKSTLSRLLRAMRDEGFLGQDEGSKAYRPGVLWHEMAASIREHEPFVARASSIVRKLCDVLGHTGYVSMLSGTSIVGLVHHVGANPLQVGVPLGQPLAVDACATGRALLAEMDDAQVHALLGGKVSRASPQAPQSFDELIERLRQVRALGHAESDNEAGPGVGALAVAVQDPVAGQRLAICVTYASEAVDQAARARAADLLRAARTRLLEHENHHHA